MASNQEEEVLGKAYDGRLMRRLLTYLRPYKWHVVIALAAIILKSGWTCWALPDKSCHR